jgi:hypothetical protein
MSLFSIETMILRLERLWFWFFEIRPRRHVLRKQKTKVLSRAILIDAFADLPFRRTTTEITGFILDMQLTGFQQGVSRKQSI